jgi:hypothetical protein
MATASGTGAPGLVTQTATQSVPRVSFADPIAQRTARHPVAIVGAVLVVAGVVTQIVALTSATWWRATVSGQAQSLHFRDFGPLSSRGFAYMYFSWGAWLVVGLTLGLGAASCLRWRGAHPFRIVGAMFAVAAAFAPIAALLVFAYQSNADEFHVVRDYALGPYLAVLGTMATALGIAAGSAR